MKYPIRTIIILFSLGLFIGYAFVEQASLEQTSLERRTTPDIDFFDGTKFGKVRQ